MYNHGFVTSSSSKKLFCQILRKYLGKVAIDDLLPTLVGPMEVENTSCFHSREPFQVLQSIYLCNFHEIILYYSVGNVKFEQPLHMGENDLGRLNTLFY